MMITMPDPHSHQIPCPLPTIRPPSDHDPPFLIVENPMVMSIFPLTILPWCSILLSIPCTPPPAPPPAWAIATGSLSTPQYTHRVAQHYDQCARSTPSTIPTIIDSLPTSTPPFSGFALLCIPVSLPFTPPQWFLSPSKLHIHPIVSASMYACPCL